MVSFFLFKFMFLLVLVVFKVILLHGESHFFLERTVIINVNQDGAHGDPVLVLSKLFRCLTDCIT